MTVPSLERQLRGVPADRYISLAAAEPLCPGLAGAPRVTRILAENLLRSAAAAPGPAQPGSALWEQVGALVRAAAGDGQVECDLFPTRLLLQDHSGVPVLADLTALRSAAVAAGREPTSVQPAVPVDLVVDHSVEAQLTAVPDAVSANLDREYRLNAERYRFLRWAESAMRQLRVVPPGQGIVHQIHLERLAQVVMRDRNGVLAPDLVLGTDSHTPMVNSVGVLGWGVGGIDASAALLGGPISMLSQPVIGVELTGVPGPGIMATDIALTMTAWLRAVGVVNTMVEYFGPGVRALSVPDRGTLANMAPEYGCTTAFFPVDDAVLEYLSLTGRPPEQVARIAAYCREQGLFAEGGADEPVGYARRLTFDLSAVEPSVSGPRRPQDRVALSGVAATFPGGADTGTRGTRPHDGDIAIAAITSCTNTANPRAMLAAGLLARRAVARGLSVPEWVKTSLAPGSRAVSSYLQAAGLSEPLARLGFGEVGYGCTTCIGNSGSLTAPMADAVDRHGVRAAAVLSGNRNFEGRIHSGVAGAYLMSPALVIAFALAGTVLVDLRRDPLGHDPDGVAVRLADLWPSEAELADVMPAVSAAAFRTAGGRASEQRWTDLPAPAGPVFDWPAGSSYLMPSPLVTETGDRPSGDLAGARALVFAPDSTTTDHISPAGQIPVNSPAGQYLLAHGVTHPQFNSYGCRRGNHEVLVRGTFANPRFRNRLAPGTTGALTRWFPSGEEMSVHDAAARYAADGVPVVILAGRGYGMGSSRDWAAKGPRLLGVRAVLAVDFERIHRSNLVSVGILPLEFAPGTDADSLGLAGTEEYHIGGLDQLTPRASVPVRAVRADGTTVEWRMRARVDTARELAWIRSGGVLRALSEEALRSPRATASG